jgi:SAM-dependent methyltransferase
MTAEYFDDWYADIARSPVRQQLFTDALGLPPEVGPSNHVPLTGLAEIASLLAVPADGVLVDLACGRGGPGMWLARSLGASLVGVDFSAEAVRQASERRALFGLTETATFAVGTLIDTGLAAGAADALVCIDAFQFSDDRAACASEMARVLRPGGRVVVTSWEAVTSGDERLGPRLRDLDVAGSLSAGGLVDVTRVERPDWHASAKAMWETTLATDTGGDPALESMQNEGERSLRTHDLMSRVMVTAAAPA